MEAFRTHTGQYVIGDKLNRALLAVASDIRENAISIRKDDDYAAHVLECQKEQDLQDMYKLADRVEGGVIETFTTWQLVNLKLTGECIAFLPK